MKVTFTPLDPKPVRPADMPDGVAYEVENSFCVPIVRVNRSGYTWSTDEKGKPKHRMLPVSECSGGKVLRRRDGQPLHGGEPVPLNTLETLPVWYRSAASNGYYSHDCMGGYTFHAADGVPHMHTGGANEKLVHPQPYIMEVQR